VTQPLIRADELAERLGVSRSMVYKLAQKRAIPYYRVGADYRFDEAEVKGFLRQERQAS
jgi:excisionase family DNA binding protein